MTVDPSQTRDVARERPEVVLRMTGALEDWKRTLPALQDIPYGGTDSRPFLVGHPDWPSTWLPARDGVPAGQVRRSSRHPNCTFFTNWRSKDDRMAWDVEVLTSGLYQAVAWYTCPAGEVGSMVELSMGGSSVRAKVDEAFDPPLWDRDDRVPRTEGYLKEFRQLKLGTLKLDKGRGQLVLRATDIPAGGVMDLRAIELTR
jgi:hypothetical protein